jgi:hypothetical protein
MWMSAIVILLGGELNSEIEHQTARDSTTGHERPLGQRGPQWRIRSVGEPEAAPRWTGGGVGHLEVLSVFGKQEG